MEAASTLNSLLIHADKLPPGLCDACLGRAGARLGRGLGNPERGRQLRGRRAEVTPSDCALCEGIADRLGRYADLALEAAGGHEFDSFLVGSVFFQALLEREKAHYRRLAELIPAGAAPAPTPGDGAARTPAFAWAEFLRQEVNREVGKRLEGRTGRRVDFDRPEITFRIDTRFDHVGLQVSPLLLKGRYRKLARDLPQTRWPCRSCGGLGCRACDYRGKTYETSVEELLAGPVAETAQATGFALHGMGREDIDARMLGSGRPFILELREPRRRRLPLSDLERRINQAARGRVEVLGLAAARPEAVAAYKTAAPEKTYRARCVAQRAVDPDRLLKTLSSFRGVTLGQRTPERVAHRRADLVRQRRILEVGLVAHQGDRFELEIRADAGTYIKEFVSGDQGRTRPSLSEALGVSVVVEELDVVDVAWE